MFINTVRPAIFGAGRTSCETVLFRTFFFQVMLFFLALLNTISIITMVTPWQVYTQMDFNIVYYVRLCAGAVLTAIQGT